MKAAIFSRDASQDIIKAYQWILKDDPSAAQAFRRSLERLAWQLGAFPRCGRERLDWLPSPYRFFALSGFRYWVVYNPNPVPPVVLRVLHGARDLSNLLEGME